MTVAAEAERVLSDLVATGAAPGVVQRFRRDRAAVGASILLGIVVVACFALEPLFEYLLGHGPNDTFPFAVNQLTLEPAGVWSHVPKLPVESGPRTLLVLGADGPVGRDEFLRLLAGGRTSLEVGIGATALALLIGTSLGTLAGFYRGWVDAVVSRLTDFVMGFPILFLVIALGLTISDRLDRVTADGLFVPGTLALIAVVGLFGWFYLARIVRAGVLELRALEFVDAARMTGARDGYIIRQHILPYLVGLLSVYGSLVLAGTIMLEAGFSILGVGVPLPYASWGNMVATNWGTLLLPGGQDPETGARTVWLTTAFPAFAILLTVLAFALVGEGLRRAFDPRGEAV